jgi:hypothetical protein
MRTSSTGRRGDLPVELYARAAGGLMGLDFRGYGGIPCDKFMHVAYTEEICRWRSIGLVSGWEATPSLPPILHMGTEEQNSASCAGLHGQKIAALGITEPTPAPTWQTSAPGRPRDGDHYIVNGAKTFITSGCRPTSSPRRSDRRVRFQGDQLLVVDSSTPAFTWPRKSHRWAGTLRHRGSCLRGLPRPRGEPPGARHGFYGIWRTSRTSVSPWPSWPTRRGAGPGGIDQVRQDPRPSARPCRDSSDPPQARGHGHEVSVAREYNYASPRKCRRASTASGRSPWRRTCCEVCDKVVFDASDPRRIRLYPEYMVETAVPRLRI